MKTNCRFGLALSLCFAQLFLIRLAAAAAPPVLRAEIGSGAIQLLWSEDSGSYLVETTDRLGPATNWWPMRRAVQSIGNQRSITLAIAPDSAARFFRLSTNHYRVWMETTLGPLVPEETGVILPHEHIFTDLRGPTIPGYAQADVEEVLRVMRPRLLEAKEAGVAMLVETTSIGVGRNVPIIKRLSDETGLPVVVPTGVYGRAQFAPPQHRGMSQEDLAQLFIREISEGIEGTGVKAGLIKIATSESALTSLEEKFLRAAGQAALATGAAIASHTTSGAVARRQVDILASISPAIRFIWVHAQAERNRRIHRELAARGVFIELDSLGWQPAEDNNHIASIKELIAAGFGDRVLLSHDAGWYQPGQPNGGTQKPYTYLHKTFIPKLRNNGLDEAAIRMITVENPIRAFAFMKK